MGCIESKGSQVVDHRLVRDQKWIDSPVGKLVLKIKNICLEKVQNKEVKKSELLLKIRLSNQGEQIHLDQLDKERKQYEKFQFVINSCYKCFGRFLLIQVWNIKGNKSNDTGLGFINLQDLISVQKQEQRHFKKLLKSFINYSNQPAGYIEFQAQFIPSQYEELSIKINSSILQTHVEGRIFAAKVIIGEQALQTKPTKVDDRNILWWKDQILTARVPSFIEFGRLQLIEKKGSSDVFWGEYSIDLKYLLNQRNSQTYVNGELQNQSEISGRIKISSKRGHKNIVTFQEMDSPKRNPKKYETSIKVIEDPSMTDHIGDSSKQVQQNENVVYRTQRAVSLPPLDVSQALKKLQFKRKKKAKDL